MSDSIVGTAVLERDGNGLQFLSVVCLPAVGSHAGKAFTIRLPAYHDGQVKPETYNGAAWKYQIARPSASAADAPVPGRLELTPSVHVTFPVRKGPESRSLDGSETIFHNVYAWGVDYVECPIGEDAHSFVRRLNPGLGI